MNWDWAITHHGMATLDSEGPCQQDRKDSMILFDDLVVSKSWVFWEP